MILFELKRKLLPVSGYLKKDAADNSGVNAAALQSANISKEALDWFKQEYANTADDRQASVDLSRQVAQSQLSGMDFANQQAKEAADRNKSIFQPLENQVVADAANYDTTDRRNQAAAEATADVERSFGSAQDGLNRSMMRMAVTPGSGRSMALMQDASLAKAKAVAGATNTAVRNVEQQGYARKMDAVGIGKGVVSNQANQQNIATSTGNAAVGSSGAALGAASSGAGLMQAGFGQALQGMGQSGSLYGQAGALTNQARGQDLSFLSNTFDSFMKSGGPAALASMFGMSGMSDKNVKKNTGKAANEDKALAEVNATPVEDGWQYDPKKGGPDDGGQKHTGPMAQKVRATMGESVAPGGKVIDLVSMNGKLMASVQSLSKKVDKLEKKVA